jgi:hypothetical protein
LRYAAHTLVRATRVPGAYLTEVLGPPALPPVGTTTIR